ncbi:hypothetical protein DUI87_16762 [Hirundo rustica rustica]|uniref:Uncharacterized protein n=1 Tax=Hirundo rustica rustica TaxID=333673 RepID=A0A3M0K7K3_HIRRU|nr:hypothetical protein DUI87_16762 [Hirundo rustica rustica]
MPPFFESLQDLNMLPIRLKVIKFSAACCNIGLLPWPLSTNIDEVSVCKKGVSSYCERYAEGMRLVLNTFGPVPEFSGETVQKVNQERPNEERIFIKKRKFLVMRKRRLHGQPMINAHGDQ